MLPQTEVLVIGAGLAGLTAAWQAAAAGRRVRVVAAGWGATHWHTGCIDVLGYVADRAGPVRDLRTAVERLVTAQPDHPYARTGVERLEEALQALQALAAAAGYPLEGSLGRNWLLPSAAGAFRPTCLAPATMTAGDLDDDAPMLIVGFRHLPDFYANVVAANLSAQGMAARHVTLELASLERRNFTTAPILAGLMEQPLFQAEVAGALKGELGDAARVGFPAVLGLDRAPWVLGEMARILGRPVFEIPGLAPSVPGMRLQRMLRAAVVDAGGEIYEGLEAVGSEREGARATAVWTAAAARRKAHRARRFVLATGGILGGGITTDHRGGVREVVFDLPLAAPADRREWFRQRFLDPAGHPIYRAGVPVDERFRPVEPDGVPVYENVLAAGTTLAGGDVIRERSLDGVALATGYAVGRLVGGA